VPDHTADYFGVVTAAVETSPEGRVVTTLICHVADQSALRGLLTYLYDRGLPLLSLAVVPAEWSGAQTR